MGSTAVLPYLGSKISLISNAGIRYEGVLSNIDIVQSTVSLYNVRTFGTEGRKPGQEVPPRDEVYAHIVFRGADIQDLTVSEPAPPEDPAIVAINPNATDNGIGYQQGMTNDVPQRGGNSGRHSSMNMSQNMMGRFGQGNMASSNGPTMNGSIMGHQFGVDRSNIGINSRADCMLPNDYPRMDHMQRGPGYMSGNYMGMRRGVHGDGNRNHGGGSNLPRRVIGELIPQPNQRLKSQVQEAFNFEEANAKLDKNIFNNAANNQTEESTEDKTEKTEDKQENTETEVPTSTLPTITTQKAQYSKDSSFFDNISCETLDRQEGTENRLDRTKQREIDAETFGPGAAVQLRNRGNGRMGNRNGGYRRNNGNHGRNYGREKRQ